MCRDRSVAAALYRGLSASRAGFDGPMIDAPSLPRIGLGG